MTEELLKAMERFYYQSPDGQYDELVLILIEEYRALVASLPSEE